jgi:nucleoside-diphosphate-sugar epimerase
MERPTLVTGGSGFVASQLVKQLLEDGVPTRATVRSLADEAKLKPLSALQAQYPGLLALFEADLLKPGSFDAAMEGCAIVHHVASPFLLPETIKDGRRQVVEPALRGTENVLASVARTPSVTRVVATSSVGAIFGDYADVMKMANRTLSEAYFNATSTLANNPYHYAKVEAEKAAWRMAEAQDRWRLVVVNPGMILGPSQAPTSRSGSLSLIDQMLKGHFLFGAPDVSLTTVDVREVARAHVEAGRRPTAHGRYILAQARMISLLDIAAILRKVHRRPWLLPRRPISDSVIRLAGPLFGVSRDYLDKHLGVRFAVDNRRSVEELGVVYRPIEETLVDHYRSWAEQRRA